MILSKTALRVAAAAIAGGFVTAAMTTSAFADWHRDHDRHWHHPRPGFVVAGPPVVYAPAPPPVVYSPAPVYEAAPPPVVGFGLNIHVH